MCQAWPVRKNEQAADWKLHAPHKRAGGQICSERNPLIRTLCGISARPGVAMSAAEALKALVVMALGLMAGMRWTCPKFSTQHSAAKKSRMGGRWDIKNESG